jgi:hypothetical protein
MTKETNDVPKPAKFCYGHIGGKLGELLAAAFIEKGWIAKDGADNKHFYITPTGVQALTKMGVDLSLIKS